jgi:hypothetical protein
MLTKVWGPPLWHFLHTVSFNYPVAPTAKDKTHYRNFILQLRHVLPCGKCRENLTKNMKTLPLTCKDMESRDTFSLYVYKLHECVNTMLGKKSGLTYSMVKRRYETFRANCVPPKPNPSLQTGAKTMNTNTINIINVTDTNKTKKIKKIEAGCTDPLYRLKSRCIMNIVPDTEQTATHAKQTPSLSIHPICQKCKLTQNTPKITKNT